MAKDVQYNNFEDCLKHGKETEALIGAFLVTRGFAVEDKSDDKLYRKIDVDLVLHKNGKDYLLEVKSDNLMHRTGNVFIEDCMYRKTGTYDGWMHYCQADVLCCYDTVNKFAYMLKWKDIKPIVKNFRRIKFWNQVDQCYGAGYLVPLSYLKQNELCLKKYDLKEFIADTMWIDMVS
ncbi:MAG: hypothetical protein VB100_14455 [Angelakisella sp.]|nr:hypothetical protein [Angelakisella sp.]